MTHQETSASRPRKSQGELKALKCWVGHGRQVEADKTMRMDMANLHDSIMRLACEPDSDLQGERLAFKRGHKQARHAAAELAAAHVQLEDAMAVIAAPLQMALEMGAIKLPENGVEDLRRGLAMYQEWRGTPLADPADNIDSDREPLPAGAVIEYRGEEATVVADQGGSELDVEVDGRQERWQWTYEGVSCSVVSCPA